MGVPDFLNGAPPGAADASLLLSWDDDMVAHYRANSPPTTHPAPRGGHRESVVLLVLKRFPCRVHQSTGLGLVPRRPNHPLATAHR